MILLIIRKQIAQIVIFFPLFLRRETIINRNSFPNGDSVIHFLKGRLDDSFLNGWLYNLSQFI